jgi:hypothetical protein
MSAVDEIRDYEPDARLWAAPGPPPLFVVRNEPDAELEVDEALRPLPVPVRPRAGDVWLDAFAGYGAFAALASRLGSTVIAVERPERRRELEAVVFLNDLERVSTEYREALTADEILELAADATALRITEVPRGFVPPPTVRRIVAPVPRSAVRRFSAAVDAAGFALRGFDNGGLFPPIVRLFAWREGS